MSKTPSARTRKPKGLNEPAVDVDNFDQPFVAATNAVAVLRELAQAKESGDIHSDERPLWSGLASMTERLMDDLERMDTEYTPAANYIFNIENGRRPGKGERRRDKTPRTGAAR